jgi:GNAT superfamily N-acetyltransferase
MSVAEYSARETLRDGRRVDIRAQRPGDRDAIAAAFRRSSPETIYRRFFGPRTGFTEKEVAFYLDLDFVNQVALVAELEEAGGKVVVGGGRYIVSEPGRAEVAFTVDDAHQGLGIASRLLRHLVAIARAAGLREFTAEVLPGNTPMLKVFEGSGLAMTLRREPGVVHVGLDLAGDGAPIQPR